MYVELKNVSVDSSHHRLLPSIHHDHYLSSSPSPHPPLLLHSPETPPPPPPPPSSSFSSFSSFHHNPPPPSSSSSFSSFHHNPPPPSSSFSSFHHNPPPPSSYSTSIDYTEREDGDSSLLPYPYSSSSSSWDAVPDLDKFLVNCYKYWRERGFASIVSAHITHVVALAFTIVFSFFLLLFVNWKDIVRCDSEESCRHVKVVVPAAPFSKWGLLEVISLFYFLIFITFLLWNLLLSYLNCRDAWITRQYFRQRLHLFSDEALTMLEWPEVVALLLRAQEENPFCIVEMNLTALDLVNIIMRQDNYLIALTNRQLLTQYIPSYIPQRLLYAKSLLWNIRWCVFGFMFTERSRVKVDFMNSPEKLEYRFRIIALLNLMLMAPILLFVVIFFFLKHADDFRSNRSVPFKREFNCFAEWTFREINELPHQLEYRLQNAAWYAEEYANSWDWQNPALQRIKLCIKYVIGAFLAVLLIIYFFDETPLMFVKLWDRNLLWYTVIFGFVMTIMRSELVSYDNSRRGHRPPPRDGHQNGLNWHLSPITMYKRIMRVVQYTHHLPANWRRAAGSGGFELSALHKYVLRDFFSNFYNYRIVHLLEEVLGVILTPWALSFWLPKTSRYICEYVRQCTYTSSIGDFCAFGQFDLRRNGSEFYNAPPPPSSFALNCSDSRSSETKPPPCHVENEEEARVGGFGSLVSPTNNNNSRVGGLKSHSGKLEKSLLTFILYYRLPPPYDDTSPMWAVWGEEEMMVQTGGSSSSSSSAFSLVPFQLERREGLEMGEGERKGSSAPHHHSSSSSSGRTTATNTIISSPIDGGGGEGERREDCCFSNDKGERNEENDGEKDDLEDLVETTMAGCSNNWKKWGYSNDAVEFVARLEKFQREQLTSCPYLKHELPAELLIDFSSVWKDSPVGYPPPLRDEIQAAYFFWLEKYYEHKSGRIFYPTNQLRREKFPGQWIRYFTEQLDDERIAPFFSSPSSSPSLSPAVAVASSYHTKS